jgi:hypothetical protein
MLPARVFGHNGNRKNHFVTVVKQSRPAEVILISTALDEKSRRLTATNTTDYLRVKMPVGLPVLQKNHMNSLYLRAGQGGREGRDRAGERDDRQRSPEQRQWWTYHRKGSSGVIEIQMLLHPAEDQR